jgi:hypothetical protein
MEDNIKGVSMKQAIFMASVLLLVCMLTTFAYAGNGPHGAAPNSGDGVSDGSGFDSPYGPFWK